MLEAVRFVDFRGGRAEADHGGVGLERHRRRL
jgi:hypothetical protein